MHSVFCQCLGDTALVYIMSMGTGNRKVWTVYNEFVGGYCFDCL